MLQPTIRTFRPGRAPEKFEFYLLSKGKHAGRPLVKPCPNCFIIACHDADNFKYWFAVCEMLFTARKFEFYIIGSVIPFIRIDDVRHMLRKYVMAGFSRMIKLTNAIAAITAHEQSLRDQLAKLAEAKRSIAGMATRAPHLP